MAKKSATKKKSSPTAGSKPGAPARSPSAGGRPAAARSAGGGKAPAADDRLSQLERLIAMMVEKDVVEVEVEDPGTRWRVRRAEPQAVTYAAPQPMPMAMPSGMQMPQAMNHGGSHPGGQTGADAASPEPSGDVFKSPMVGTFYRSGSPDSEAFCKPGDRVGSDRTLCIIEAMKVMNEIKAEREFEILDVLVKNGESVEFGQPLFLVR